MKTLQEIRKKTAVLTFGRMNPPTVGHEKLINKVLSVAKSYSATPFIFLSHTQDAKKNPLSSSQKLKYIELGIPAAAGHVVADVNIRTVFDALGKLKDSGYTDVILVVGSDRVSEFEKTVRPYIKHPDPKKSLDLDSFSVVSAGDRDPDDAGVAGMSASKMREFAIKNDFSSFFKGVPSHLSERFAKEMFDLIRKSLKISEMVESVQAVSNSLNIPRNKMPQISKEFIPDFLKTLTNSGVNVSRRDIPLKNLKPTQNQINTNRVREKFESFSDGAQPKPFIVSYDNYILDGHHQLFALKILDPSAKVDCHFVGLPMKDLLQFAHDFPKTKYKNIDD